MVDYPQYHSVTWSEHDDDDSILAKRVKNYLWDSTNLDWVRMAGNSSGEITVAGDSFLPASNVIEHDTATTVAGSSQTTIVTYTNTAVVLWLDGFIASGTVDAEYSLQVDAVDKFVLRSAEEDRNVQFHLPKPIKINASSVITIKVIHYKTYTGDFEATILGSRF